MLKRGQKIQLHLNKDNAVKLAFGKSRNLKSMILFLDDKYLDFIEKYDHFFLYFIKTPNKEEDSQTTNE